MRRFIVVGATPVAVAAAAVGFVVAWRRNPRIGTGFVNERMNPWLIQRGLSGVDRSEFGTIEHYGRRSGTRRLTPVHPEPADNGFRIIVPLGRSSEWARNVLAAGHCRMQLRGVVYELDEPSLAMARDVEGLPAGTRWVFDRLGFMYLRLRRFAEHPGSLEPIETESPAVAEPTESDVVRPSAVG
jgi:deazaflavin-dependent oxidoreductase (nitroreductase family)